MTSSMGVYEKNVNRVTKCFAEDDEGNIQLCNSIYKAESYLHSKGEYGILLQKDKIHDLRRTQCSTSTSIPTAPA